MLPLAAATIVAKNYLPRARVLAESFRRFHPDVPLLVEVVGSGRKSKLTTFDLTPKVIAVKAKPVVLSRLLDEYRSALFIDPDVLVTGDLRPLFALVEQHSVVLTPHLTAPLEGEQRIARELNILQSGTFNGGLIGVSQSGRGFLDWWRDRLERYCEDDVARGMYYDQRWLDLAPVFFRDVFILRDRGYNVAHWNLPERRVRIDGDAILVDGDVPCRFIHFSGFDPKRPDVVSRYSNARASGDARTVFERYASMLNAAGRR